MAATTAIATAAAVSTGYNVYANYQNAKRSAKANAAALASRPSAAEDQMKANRAMLAAQDLQRRKSQGANGRGSTILTGPAGIQNAPPPATKTLLGL